MNDQWRRFCGCIARAMPDYMAASILGGPTPLQLRTAVSRLTGLWRPVN